MTSLTPWNPCTPSSSSCSKGSLTPSLLRDDVPLATQAALLQELLLATLHSAVLSGGQSTSADHLWAFCSAAILRTAT